jgi:hypothetical protein
MRPNTGSGRTFWRAQLIKGERAEFRCTQMRVRSVPLILGKEFADEGCRAESHSDGDPAAPGYVFIPHLTCQADLPSPPTKSQKGLAPIIVPRSQYAKIAGIPP